jgi:hypothetical protein
MVSILIVEKTGSLKQVVLKTYNEAELYKKAGFKTATDFGTQTTWKFGSNVNIRLFGKTNGRAGQENKYDFPPPVDSKLFFGSCVLVNITDGNEAIDLSIPQWKVVYEKLFGGFEDIGEEDSEEEDADDEDDDVSRTKEGYVKDDFVVGDEDEDEDEDDDEDEDEDGDGDEDEDGDDDDEEITPKRKSKPVLRKSTREKKKKSIVENVFISANDAAEEYLDCTSELSEEEYV